MSLDGQFMTSDPTSDLGHTCKQFLFGRRRQGENWSGQVVFLTLSIFYIALLIPLSHGLFQM